MPSFIQRSWLRVCLLILMLCAILPAQTAQGKPVSRELVEARLQKYIGDDAQRESTLKQMLTEAGCDDGHLSEQAVKGSQLPNVVCVLPGRTNATIIVGAHFDHILKGDGVIDNWSSASLLPSLYEAIKLQAHKHTYIFVGFTGEESGLVGSRFYTRRMTREEAAAIDAMVNMDALGLGPAEIWAGHADHQLSGAMAYVASQLNMPVSEVKVDDAIADSEPFASRKIPSITIHSVTPGTRNILHTPKDKISAVRFDHYYQTYRLLLAYIAFLDDMPRMAAKSR